MSHDTLTRLGMRTEALDRAALRQRFPFLDADLARIDLDGGVVDVPAVTRALTRRAARARCRRARGRAPSAVMRDGAPSRVITGAGELRAGALVVTAGHGTNHVLSLLPGRTLRVPITKDRPSEAKYLTPPAAVRDRFVAGRCRRSPISTPGSIATRSSTGSSRP